MLRTATTLWLRAGGRRPDHRPDLFACIAFGVRVEHRLEGFVGRPGHLIAHPLRDLARRQQVLLAIGVADLDQFGDVQGLRRLRGLRFLRVDLLGVVGPAMLLDLA